MAGGFEGYSASRTFYSSVQNAAKQNVPGADIITTELGKRFVKGPKLPQPPQP